MAEEDYVKNISPVAISAEGPTAACACPQENEMQNSEEFEVENAKYKRRHQKPLFFCTFIVNNPRLSFGFLLSSHLVMASLNFVLMAAGITMFPTVFNTVPLSLNLDTTRLREWAWQYRDDGEGVKINRYTLNKTGPDWVRGLQVDVLEMFYVHNMKNVLTEQNLRRINYIENGIYNMNEYQRTFCQLNATKGCVKPRSIIRFFDGTYKDISPIFYDPDFKNVTKVLDAAASHPLTKDEFTFFMSHRSSSVPGKIYTLATRTNIPLGWPLEGPGSGKEKKEKVEKFIANAMAPRIEQLKSQYAGDLEVTYISIEYFLHEAPLAALGNLMFALGSITFVFLFMWSQTKSLWVTSLGIFSLVTCFFITNFIYRIILDYRFFGYFHLISIFIILGIGADDIFVFYNTWKATGTQAYPSLAHRLSDCFRRSAGTMFFTSLTTAVAFGASGFSPLMPIHTFSAFTAILVAVNYFSVIIYFPTVVIMHHLYYEDQTVCMCCIPRKWRTSSGIDLTAEEAGVEKSPDRFVVFFRDTYFRFVTHKWVRWVILCVFAVLIGFSTWAVSLLKPATSQVRVFKLNTDIGKAWELAWNGFKPSGHSDFISVIITWGLKERDQSSCHFTDHGCRGRGVWDDTFDLNLPPAQQSLKEFCHKLKHGLTDKEVHDLRIASDSLTNERQVECFLFPLERFMKEDAVRLHHIHNVSLDLALPLGAAEMSSFMKLHDPEIYNVSSLPKTFYRFFEIANAYWLTNQYSFLITDDFMTYDRLVGEYRDYPNTRLINNADETKVGFYATRLRYIGIRVNLTISPQTPYYNGLPVMRSWDNFMDSELKKMPTELQGGFQCSYLWWHWMKVQENLVHGAVQGILIGIGLAIPVLFLATTNIIVGLVALVTLCCITITVIGIIPLIGWKLGILTSINMSVVVGLSVDYVLHMAEGYHLSERSDRMGRVQDMLENLGPSVVCGALTTIGSSFFLFFGKIQFFLQFGAFMFSVIGFSMVYALGLLTVLLSLIGPENNTGSFVVFFRWVKRLISGRKSTDSKCQNCDGKGFIAGSTTAEKASYHTGLQSISLHLRKPWRSSKASYEMPQ